MKCIEDSLNFPRSSRCSCLNFFSVMSYCYVTTIMETWLYCFQNHDQATVGKTWIKTHIHIKIMYEKSVNYITDSAALVSMMYYAYHCYFAFFTTRESVKAQPFTIIHTEMPPNLQIKKIVYNR